MMLAQADWDVRRYIYDIFAGAGKPPEAQDIAQQFGSSVKDAKASLRRLHLGSRAISAPGQRRNPNGESTFGSCDRLSRGS